MLRRRSSSWLLPRHLLHHGSGRIRFFQNSSVDPDRNNQQRIGPLPQHRSAHYLGAQQAPTLGEQYLGQDVYHVRGWPVLGFNPKPSPYEKVSEWQDFQLHGSTFCSQFSALSLPQNNVQSRTAFHPGKGRHYGVVAYQDSDSQSECEASDLDENSDSQFKTRAKISGPAADRRHRRDGVAATLREVKELTPPAGARDVSKLINQKPTPFHVCKILQKQHDPELAWQFFQWAGQQDGYAHTSQTYNAMLMTFSAAKRFTDVFRLLEIMRSQSLFLTGKACSSIIKCLAVEEMFDEAIRVFERAQDYCCTGSSLMYNCYLDVLVKARRYDRLETAFAEMQAAGHVPTLYTYNILINGFARADKVEKASSLYKEMKAKGIAPNVITYNTLLHSFREGGKTDEALKLFAEIVESGFVPSLFTHSILKAVHERGEPGGGSASKPRKQVESLEQRRKGGLEFKDLPSQTAYHSLIPLLCNEEDPVSALQVLRDMESRGFIPSTSMYNLVLSSLGKAGHVDTAMELFSYMTEAGCVPDRESYILVITAHCKAGNADEAVRLHEELVTRGIHSTTWLCNLVLDLLSRSGQVDRLFEFFRQIRHCKPDAHTYNILMATVCLGRNSQKVLAWLKRVGLTTQFLTTRTQGGLCVLERAKRARGPQTVIYNTFMRMLCREGRVEEAHSLLLDMRSNGLVPEVQSCCMILDKLGNSGQVNRAWKFFQQMEDTRRDLIAYSIMIKILARASSFGKAYKLLHEMRTRGVEPNQITYTALLNALGKAGRLEEMHSLFLEMQADGCMPETTLYNCVLDAFARAGQVDRAYALFEESIDRGCLPDSFSYNAILRGYFESNRTEEALDLYAVMKGMGCVPSGHTRDIVWSGLTNAGLEDMAWKLLGRKKRSSG